VARKIAHHPRVVVGVAGIVGPLVEQQRAGLQRIVEARIFAGCPMSALADVAKPREP
jgi:hypothetical protein